MVVISCWKSRHKNSRGTAPYRIESRWQLLFLLFVTQICGTGAVGVTKNVVQKDAEFDVIYSDTVTSENQTIYAFNHTISRNKVSFKWTEYTILPRECGYVCFSHVYLRRRECVCLWTCCPRVLRVRSCLWYDRSKLCSLSRFLSYCEACKYISTPLVGIVWFFGEKETPLIVNTDRYGVRGVILSKQELFLHYWIFFSPSSLYVFMYICVISQSLRVSVWYTLDQLFFFVPHWCLKFLHLILLMTN